jgi:hypothetical protein
VLKASDVGVTLGVCASAAEDAADVVVNVNNFSALVAAIREGRQVFENLKKIVAYCIITCTPQLVAFLAFALLRMPLPFSVPLVLLIDCGTNLIPSIGMAFEVKEEDLNGGIMARDPRNTFLDRLLTGKMFFFSCLQLGVIQACSGCYAYLVVMNDFGYPPHLMMGGGDSDYWGHYPIYCQFVGGQYVNVKGEIDHTRYPSDQPPSFDYALWDEADNGYVKKCVFPVKNVEGTAEQPASEYMKFLGKKENFTIANALSYDGNTGAPASTVLKSLGMGGPDLASVEGIEALEAAGYFEYTPWKSRVSGFWKTEWLAYDIRSSPESTSENQVPEGRSYWWMSPQKKGNAYDWDVEDPPLSWSDVARYYNKMSFGLWSVCLEDPTLANDHGNIWYSNAQQREAVYGWSGNGTTGCKKPGTKEQGPLSTLSDGDSDEGTVLLYTDAIFCNGDRSYDRLLSKHGIEWDYHHGRWKVIFSDTNGPTAAAKLAAGDADQNAERVLDWDSIVTPLTSEQKTELKRKAETCWRLDDHPHQVKYCYDECSTDCDRVPAEDRANTTLWNTNEPNSKAGTWNSDGVSGRTIKQCASISSRKAQQEALHSSRTAFAVAVIMCQLFAAATVKTRWQSILTPGMDNTYINFGIAFGIILTAYCVYTPWGILVLGTRPLRFTHWLPAVPWAFVLLAYDEVRKFMMRITTRMNLETGKMEKGWIEKNSMY